jgi:choline dehydrogenase-like flavoprotein
VAALEYDVIVVGSGFGGSVTALRLSEKGYRVAVLESGRRFTSATFPKTSWHLRSFLWAPKLGCYGIQRISLLKDVMILSGAGVGGGSLVYSMRHWSEQTIIALVMQTSDNSITCYTKRGLLGRRLTSGPGHGEPNPTWIPAGHDAVRRIAPASGGWPGARGTTSSTSR